MRQWIYEIEESFRIAFDQILSHKLRSILTALGVIIGILAVTLMGTAINGIDKGFDRSLSLIGYDVLYVQKWPWRRIEEWWVYRNRPKLETDYADALNRKIKSNTASELLTVVPQMSKTRQVFFEGESIENVFIIGTTDTYQLTSSADLSIGRFFTNFESRSGAKICILGSDVVEALFPNINPINQYIKIGKHRFKIIGVYEKQGKFLGLFSLDTQVVIPLLAFQKAFGESRQITLRVKVKDESRVSYAKDELIGLMRQIRGLDYTEDNDFTINEQRAFKSTLDPIKAGISIAGLFITGLSLFVGAIGIMNITFVSVKERTKEIGTRKALGAKRRSILLQFLIESTSICLIGGIIGLFISFGATVLVNVFFETFPVSFSLELVVVGMVVSTLTGIFSGFAPAYSASKLNPSTALRYE